VPSLTGDTVATAGTALKAAGLVLGTVTNVVDPTCGHIGKVMSQSPVAGTRVNIGTAVAVRVGTRPAPAGRLPVNFYRPVEPSMTSRIRSACPLCRAYSSTRCCHIQRTEMVLSPRVKVSSSFAPSSAASTARHSAR